MKVRIKTLGDIAGRESGALIVLLVAIGGLALASPEFLTGNNKPVIMIFRLRAAGFLHLTENRCAATVHTGASFSEPKRIYGLR